MARSVRVPASGKFVFFLSGREDLLAPATKENSADKLPSLMYRMQNQLKLPTFDRNIPTTMNKSVSMNMESEDMYYNMHGPTDGRRMLEVVRRGKDMNVQGQFKSDFMSDEVPTGKIMQRAQSAEPLRLEAMPDMGGSMTAREVRTSDTATELRFQWPNSPAAYSNFPSLATSLPRSKSAAPVYCRKPNGVSDFGGYSGLGMWRSARTEPTGMDTSKTPATERPKTPGRERPKTPLRSSAVGRGSPEGNATQPSAALDTTRRKGAEFPRTPQANAKASEASNGGSKAKGVWSSPDSLKFASNNAGVSVFSL
jgi:hypothetical protein